MFIYRYKILLFGLSVALFSPSLFAKGMFEFLDPCIAAKSNFHEIRANIRTHIAIDLNRVQNDLSEKYRDLWWEEKRKQLRPIFDKSQLASIMEASGASLDKAFIIWLANQVEGAGGIDEIDKVIVSDFRKMTQLELERLSGATEAKLEKQRRELYGECKEDILDQTLRDLLTVTMAPIDVISGNWEGAKRESGELDKIIRATSGISIRDINKHGICGGPNSEFRLVFGPLCGDSTEYVSVPIWYATDRNITSLSTGQRTYGGNRGVAISYGTAVVTIPTDHKMGELESPSWWKLEFRNNPEKHVILSSVTAAPKGDFFASLRNKISKTSSRELFVFIHGFNVSFEDAARRTAQMAYDLNFQGAPVLYSWPSKNNVASYLVDANNSDWTVPNLEEFLLHLSHSSGALTIHVIAHSMGNKPLIHALSRMASSGSGPSFNQIVLAAPDLDAAVFTDLANRITPLAERITLYASSNDKALNISKQLGGDYRRAGEAGDEILVLLGVDTIDASAVTTSFLGHSYYGENRSILTDVFHLLKENKEPKDRFGLIPKYKNDLSFWYFRP